MSRDLCAALQQWLADGLQQVGQLAIRTTPEGFALTHCDDVERADLKLHTGLAAARLLATYDDKQQFRPLKTAPNLCHGWKLSVPDVAGLRLALDAFYPAMLGSWLSQQLGELHPVPLRDTLNRQSGMYAVTKKLTDPQAQELVAQSCNSEHGCLKVILWQLSATQPLTSLPAAKSAPLADPAVAGGRALPLLCSEACNLLVANAREVVKQAPAVG